MTSKFFTKGSSSESEESQEEIEDSGEGTKEDVKIPSKFQKGVKGEESSEEEETQEKRIVRSTRDKRFEEITTTIGQLRNHIKINDWNSIHNDFEKLNKQIDKTKQIIQKEGIPRIYIKALVMLEDAIVTTKESKEKAGNKNNAKSYNAMKQKLKKHNKTYEKEIGEYRKNPDGEEEEEEKGEKKGESEEEEEEDLGWMDEPDSEEEGTAKPKEKDTGFEDESEESSGGEAVEKENKLNKWFTAPKKMKKKNQKLKNQ